METGQLTKSEITNAVRLLNYGKAAGLNGMSAEILKADMNYHS